MSLGSHVHEFLLGRSEIGSWKMYIFFAVDNMIFQGGWTMLLNIKMFLLGCLGSSASRASDSWSRFRSQCQGCEFKRHPGLCARHGAYWKKIYSCGCTCLPKHGMVSHLKFSLWTLCTDSSHHFSFCFPYYNEDVPLFIFAVCVSSFQKYLFNFLPVIFYWVVCLCLFLIDFKKFLIY